MRVFDIPGTVRRGACYEGCSLRDRDQHPGAQGQMLLAVTPQSPARSEVPSSSHLFMQSLCVLNSSDGHDPGHSFSRSEWLGPDLGTPTSEQSPGTIGLLKGEQGSRGGIAARVALDSSAFRWAETVWWAVTEYRLSVLFSLKLCPELLKLIYLQGIFLSSWSVI